MNEILDEHLTKKEPLTAEPSQWFYILWVLIGLGSIISTLVAWYEIESIIVSGPVMSIIGLVLLIINYKQHDKTTKTGWIAGIIPIALSVFWLLTIVLFELSPDDCREITPLSLTVGTLIILILGVRILLKKS